MWIVRLALRRTYTFVVVALLIAVLGAVSIYRMSTDIFPNIDIPIVSVVWSYTGMPAEEIESRIILINERVLTASVNDIEHIESQSLDGVGVIRIYFQPGAKVAEAEAQVTATCQTLLKLMPPGITPQYNVRLNSSPDVVAAFNDIPIKTVNGVPIYVKNVGHAADGYAVQTNVVRRDGRRAVLMTILKGEGASTLSVVQHVRDALPGIEAQLPPELKLEPLFDQSIFVRAAVQGVLKEGAIAAGLTALMILLFLGSWRSTLIVMISIPLSIAVSIIMLGWLGQTLNVMTLGGMALAVGILVDDATVEIENIHRNLHQRKRLVKAILDGASQIAVPAFVSTMCICIVFVPVVFISGAAKYLFTPLSMAVVFAMMTSYLLSRTLVPTMVHYLLASEVERYGGELDPDDPHAADAIYAKEHHGEHRHHTSLLHRRWFKGFLMLLPAALAACVFAIPIARAWTITHWRTLSMIALGTIGTVGVLFIIVHYDLIWRTHDAFNAQFEKLRRFYGGM